VVLAAPSGTGKTTIAHRLVGGSADFAFSVSATTRPRRPDERDGVDYHFVTRERFQAMERDGDLAEWAVVHGELYGTPRAELEAALGRGRHVVLDIDVQGAAKIREAIPEAVLVFVLPPSVDVLVSRLSGRGTEAAGEVARRLRTALHELTLAKDFDYVLVNDDVERCVAEVQTIVSAEGYRPRRAASLERDVEALRSKIGRVLETEFENANA
jgi:guanylate kinase